MIRVSVYLAAVVLGIGCSIAMFPPYADSPVTRPILDYLKVTRSPMADRAKGLQYSGLVDTSDMAGRSIVIKVPSSYPLSDQPAMPVRFNYDDKTEWYSATYTFDGDILQKKTIAAATSRDLPEGAIVMIVRDPESGSAMRAMEIIYLNKNAI